MAPIAQRKDFKRIPQQVTAIIWHVTFPVEQAAIEKTETSLLHLETLG